MAQPIDWIFTTKETPIDDQVSQLKDKISAAVNHIPEGIPTWASIPPVPNSKAMYWVKSLYPDYVILCGNDYFQYFRQNYHTDENGEVVLDGEMVQVEPMWVPVNSVNGQSA